MLRSIVAVVCFRELANALSMFSLAGTLSNGKDISPCIRVTAKLCSQVIS